MKKLKILANIPKYDYGKPELGNSFEYDTFFRFFKSAGYSIDIFDYTSLYKKFGKERMNKKLSEQVKKKLYDVVFTVPFTNQFTDKALNSLKLKHSGAYSIAWMCDDKWRWDNFSKKLAFSFDYVITTDPDAVHKYRSIGYKSAILAQWAHDPLIYRKISIKKKYDVVFIGGNSPWRSFVVAQLKDKGIHVECFGAGWDNGRVSVQESVVIYNQSKIVLNLSNSTQFNLKYFLSFHRPIWHNNIKESLFQIAPGIAEYIISKKRMEDIKARFFEVTGTGAFLLSYPVEYLERYLVPGRELVLYNSIDDLYDLISYYLKHENERNQIAENGYVRTSKEHTYQKRFIDIFNKIGL